MLRVAVSGYYGFDNTGDEAMLFSLIGTLRALSPGVRLTVFSNNPRRTGEHYGVKAISCWNPPAILWTLLRSDILLSGGVGLLPDETNLRGLYHYLSVAAAAKLLGKTVVYYAQGVGYPRSRLSRWLTRLVSNRVDLITVRDQTSRDDFLEMGVTRPPIVVTADPVLALNPLQIDLEKGRDILTRLRLEQYTEEPAGREEAGEEKAPSEKRLLGIVLRNWKDYRVYIHQVAAAADRMARQGWEILLLPFQHPGDWVVCRELSSLMQERHLIVRDELPAEAMISLIGRLDLLLGMRLHALIIASVLRIPCVGIDCDPRVASFLEMSGQVAAGSINEIDSESLYQKLSETWEKRSELIARLDEVMQQLRQQAWETPSLAMSVFFARAPHRRSEPRRVRDARPGTRGKGI